MTDENLPPTTLGRTSIEPGRSNNEALQHHWHGVVKRRCFLKSIGVARVVLSAGVALISHAQATRSSTGRLPKGDSALLRLTAAVELIEADPMQAKEDERWLELEREIQAFEEWRRNP
jgi:hypothetical protein